MNNEQQGEQAWTLHNAITENEKQRRLLLLENMELIHKLHSSKLYRAIIGDDNAPWAAYLTQHEVFYSASKVYMLDKIYSCYVKELSIKPEDIADIPHTKLANMISLVNKDNVYEWLAKARVLTSQDFNDEIRVAAGKESYLQCKHSNTKNYEICQSCGFRHAK